MLLLLWLLFLLYRLKGQTFLYLTHKALLSEEPGSRATLITSFPVTPFLSTLTSLVSNMSGYMQMSVCAKYCVFLSMFWYPCLHPCLSLYVGAFLYVCMHIYICFCGYIFVLFITLLSPIVSVTFLSNDFPSHSKGQLSFCLPASLES